MRAIWKGAVTFGLVNVPVKLYSATEDHDVPLHQVHDADGGRIRYKRVCELDGEVVPYEHIDRAYDDGEHTVVITKEDLAALPAESNREIEVVEFVPSEQIDPIMYDRTYYLEPDSKSPKAYVLLRRTLEETDRTAVVKFALRQRTRLAALRVRDDVLVLQTLLWADEVREPDFGSLDEDVKVSSTELKMAQQLVTSFESDFTPEEFEDEYQVQLRQLIEAKIEQGEAVDTAETFGAKPEGEEGAEVIDLMEALKRSVASAKGGGKDTKGSDGAKGSGGSAESGGTAKGTGRTSTSKSTSKGKSGGSRSRSGSAKDTKERVAR
ncbi:Ku protein [Isoptericola variabilis]|uniref:Non-homologous end joining protein Ku n=1 Tax=Isoptericola variabilis (strain 225) TaxID=743718 RepID=F6FPL1_ISOV2|nr:Ku protein [Isoptericola variabilis]AEG44743.1 DNA repair protein [Isoptericola variabilis 225]TWH32356.1 DNA end-binding protein Ku [Isoptericola variabilis J7]